MRKFLKTFVKLSWRGIPIGIIASVLVVVVVVAAVVISALQTITQEVVVQPAPPEPSVVAAGFALPAVYEDETFTWEAGNPVLVSPVTSGRYLSIVLTADPGYADLEVTLTITASPDLVVVPIGTAIVVDKTGAGTNTNQLLLGGAGTYAFSEKVTGTVGSVDSLTTDLLVAIDDADPGYDID